MCELDSLHSKVISCATSPTKNSAPSTLASSVLRYVDDNQIVVSYVIESTNAVTVYVVLLDSISGVPLIVQLP